MKTLMSILKRLLSSCSSVGSCGVGFLLDSLITGTRSGRHVWPSSNTDCHDRSRLDLLSLSLKLFHVPISPNHPTFQESGLWASEPYHKLGGQLDFEHVLAAD